MKGNIAYEQGYRCLFIIVIPVKGESIGYTCGLAISGDAVALYASNGILNLKNNEFLKNNGKYAVGEIVDMKYYDKFIALKSNGTVIGSSDGEEWSVLYQTPTQSYQYYSSFEIVDGKIFLFASKGNIYWRTTD